MNSKNQSETLQEQVKAIADVPVSTAISNLQTEYIAIAKRLRGYSIQVHGSILNMLQTEFALRQDETKNAIEEHKFHLAVQQREEAARAQKALEAQQEEIAQANRPTLAAVGGATRPQ
jgi:hypothetical protein